MPLDWVVLYSNVHGVGYTSSISQIMSLVKSGDSAGQAIVTRIDEDIVASQAHFPLVQVHSSLAVLLPPGNVVSLVKIQL
jgi:hypothetical protein